jgi:hypothetical protein
MFAMGLIGVLLFLVYMSVPLMFLVLWWAWRSRGLEQARKWPRTEAIIQSAEVQVKRGTRGAALKAPVCAFSYTVNGVRYSGRFSLVSGESASDSAVDQLVDQKLPLLYDPAHPKNWYIPMEHWRGYFLEQKMGVHSARRYPKN